MGFVYRVVSVQQGVRRLLVGAGGRLFVRSAAHDGQKRIRHAGQAHPPDLRPRGGRYPRRDHRYLHFFAGASWVCGAYPRLRRFGKGFRAVYEGHRGRHGRQAFSGARRGGDFARAYRRMGRPRAHSGLYAGDTQLYGDRFRVGNAEKAVGGQFQERAYPLLLRRRSHRHGDRRGGQKRDGDRRGRAGRLRLCVPQGVADVARRARGGAPDQGHGRKRIVRLRPRAPRRLRGHAVQRIFAQPHVRRNAGEG